MLFDPEIVQTLVDGTPAWVGLLFLLVAILGSSYVVLPVCLTLAYRATTRRDTLWWGGLPLGGLLLVTGLKYGFGHSRPSIGPPFEMEALPTVVAWFAELSLHQTTPSFPSGHAFGAMVVYGALASELDYGARTHRALIAGSVIVLVGISRVIHGMHYPGDVVAGIVLGGLYLEGMIRLKNG